MSDQHPPSPHAPVAVVHPMSYAQLEACFLAADQRARVAEHNQAALLNERKQMQLHIQSQYLSIKQLNEQLSGADLACERLTKRNQEINAKLKDLQAETSSLSKIVDAYSSALQTVDTDISTIHAKCQKI